MWNSAHLNMLWRNSSPPVFAEIPCNFLTRLTILSHSDIPHSAYPCFSLWYHHTHSHELRVVKFDGSEFVFCSAGPEEDVACMLISWELQAKLMLCRFLWPFCSWVYSDAVWPRGWGRVHHGLQLPNVRSTSLCYCPFKFWQQAGLWVKGRGRASSQRNRFAVWFPIPAGVTYGPYWGQGECSCGGPSDCWREI